jgi:hypothetical protein
MKIKLLCCSILASLSINAEYIVTISHESYLYQEVKYINGWSESGINEITGKNYDENGFLQNGLHKDTGTDRDPEGFDIKGFKILCKGYKYKN